MGRLLGLLIGCRNSLLAHHCPKRHFNMHSIKGPSAEEVEALRKGLYGNLCRENLREILQHPVPPVNNPVVRAKRSKLFSEEKENQRKAVGRVEKIEVQYVGLPEDVTLMMNKEISTPYDCAKHLSEVHVQRSVVAEVNGQLWDMHRPILDPCKLRLLHMKMKDEDPFHVCLRFSSLHQLHNNILNKVNKIYWRSCSFMLGSVLETALHDHIYVELHSFPPANVRSGSFVYDVDLKIKDWKPNSEWSGKTLYCMDEMRIFSLEMRKLSQKNLPFERLEVNTDLALEMFQDNQYKRQQIPEKAANSPNGKTVCLYRVGDFVDISKGPLMSTTGLLGRCTITAVHPLVEAKNISETLYRVQGVALPAGFLMNEDPNLLNVPELLYRATEALPLPEESNLSREAEILNTVNVIRGLVLDHNIIFDLMSKRDEIRTSEETALGVIKAFTEYFNSWELKVVEEKVKLFSMPMWDEQTVQENLAAKAQTEY